MGKKATTKGGSTPPTRRDIAQNRKALHEYEILDRYEAGISLAGSEVKGLRESGAMIREAYAQVINDEVFLVGAHISDYGPAGGRGHDPQRTRRLAAASPRDRQDLRQACRARGHPHSSAHVLQ